MNAQFRAISDLCSLIKQFISFADEADKRRLNLEPMQTGLELTKALSPELKLKVNYKDYKLEDKTKTF